MQTNTATPGTAGGNREDLRNDITLLEPQERPYTSLVDKRSEAKSTFIETLSDRMRAPRTTGAREDAPTGKGGNKAVKRGRFGVYLHRSFDEYSVTRTQQLISQRGGVAGVPNEMARDAARTELEVLRDIEAVNCSDLETQDGAGGAADMRTRGAFTWLTPAGTTLSPTVPDDFRVPADAVMLHGNASGLLFSEDQLVNLIKDGLKPIHGGKKEFTIIAGNNVCNTIDHFSRIVSSSVIANPAAAQFYTVRQGADDLTVRMMVNIYETSMGMLHVMSTEFNKVNAAGTGDPNAALILFNELWYLDMLEDLDETERWDNASGEGGVFSAQWANICRSPRGNGKIVQS